MSRALIEAKRKKITTDLARYLGLVNKLYLNSKDLQIPTISMTSKYLVLKPVEQLNFRSVSHGDLMFRKNHKTPIKKVWDMIRKISGKNISPSYTHLNMVGTDSKATSKTDIADTLGETFCHNSSSFNYSESFKKIKTEQEKAKSNFKLQNNEIYIKDFIS